MKKTTLFVICIIIGLLVYYPLQSAYATKAAEKVAINYYTALINENYEEAFEYLYVYDDNFDVRTSLSKAETKNEYLKNINSLKERGYRVKGFEINNIKQDDGSLTLINTTVTVEYDQKIESKNETLQYNKSLVFVNYSEDQFGHYRGGKLNMVP